MPNFLDIIFVSYPTERTCQKCNFYPLLDAYIGKIFPAFPPHFSAGISSSGTLIDTSFIVDGVQTLFDQIKESLATISGEAALDFSLPQQFVLPTFALRARVGGLILPFDVGAFFVSTVPGTFDSLSFDDFSGGLNYTAFGADLRYAIIEGNLIIPQVSVGAGYIHHAQDLSFSAKKKVSYTGESSSSGELSTAAKLALSTDTLFFSAQISKQIFITTPYLGFRLLVTQSTKDYDWNFTTVIDGQKNNNASKSGKNSITEDFDFANITPQIFGGATLKILLFELAAGVSYNPISNLWSGCIQTNFRM